MRERSSMWVMMAGGSEARPSRWLQGAVVVWVARGKRDRLDPKRDSIALEGGCLG